MSKFKILSISFLLITLACKNGTPTSSTDDSVSEIVDIDLFSKLMMKDHQLIDVRTPEEFAEGYISNAKNINYRSPDFKSQIISLDKSKPVLVYCKSGGRSAKSAAIFQENGFGKVYDLKGGITAWMKAGQPIGK